MCSRAPQGSLPCSIVKLRQAAGALTRGGAEPAVALVVECVLVVPWEEAALEPDLVGHAGIPAMGGGSWNGSMCQFISLRERAAEQWR